MPLFGVRNSVLRRLVLRVFRTVNPGDIGIRHHWTGDRLHLHSFNHKGYWWHGKKREMETIQRFYRLIKPGDTVVEVGGHIGYFSLIYARLVGSAGRVSVFEPGENNLPYLRRNLAGPGNVSIIEKAVSNESGEVTFWLENLSGQNNSMIKDYHLLDGNIELAGLGASVTKRAVTVPATTLDEFAAETAAAGGVIDFVKIDVEGAELMVLEGAAALLSDGKPILMVEVTREAERIHALLTGKGYELRYADGSPIGDPSTMEGNVFCLPNAAAIADFGE